MKAREWHAMRRYSKDGTFRFDSNMHAASFHRKANVIDRKKTANIRKVFPAFSHDAHAHTSSASSSCMLKQITCSIH